MGLYSWIQGCGDYSNKNVIDNEYDYFENAWVRVLEYEYNYFRM